MKARKKTLIAFSFSLLLFLCLTSSTAPGIKNKLSSRLLNAITEKGGNHSFKAWVFFSDKGPGVQHRIKTVREGLNFRSYQRRLKHRAFNDLVDEFDVPVYGVYVHQVRSHVERIRHGSRWLNAVSVEAKGRSLKKIARNSFVKRVDFVHGFYFKKPLPGQGEYKDQVLQPPGRYVLDYGPSFAQVDMLNVPVLHDSGLSANGILICMLDAGFNNLAHEALDHLDIVATWDFVNNDPDVSDETGQMGNGDHGTQTLGTIAGYHPGELIGPAYGASFLLGKTENTEWERHIEEDHWIAGAEWADTWGADIISSSLGYRGRFSHGESSYSWEDMDGETTIVTRGANIAASRGILVVNSAGNEGTGEPIFDSAGNRGRVASLQNTLVAPSDSEQVLAVGAVDSSGNRAYFSSIGPTADGRIKPDVMAMGMRVYTTSPTLTNSYDGANGTSFSCPLVAGVAALVLEANPAWTQSDIIRALKITAANVSDPDNFMGWGIVDAQAAALYTLKDIFPPTDFALQRVENNYGFFSQYVDRLSWNPNPQNEFSVREYRLYAREANGENSDFALIAELRSSVFSYDRRGVLEEEIFVYKIISVSETGEESDPEFTR